MDSFDKKEFFDYVLSKNNKISEFINNIDGVKYLSTEYPIEWRAPFLSMSIKVDNEITPEIMLSHVVPFLNREHEEVHVNFMWKPTRDREYENYLTAIISEKSHSGYGDMLDGILDAISGMFVEMRK